MTKTQNLNLPQWEANDEIKREDFNAAMSALDNTCQVECISVDMTDKVSGDTVYTFAKAPRFVLLQGVYNLTLIPADTTVVVWDFTSNNSDYFVTFQLDGTTLIMVERLTTRAFKTMSILAFY